MIALLCNGSTVGEDQEWIFFIFRIILLSNSQNHLWTYEGVVPCSVACSQDEVTWSYCKYMTYVTVIELSEETYWCNASPLLM